MLFAHRSGSVGGVGEYAGACQEFVEHRVGVERYDSSPGKAASKTGN